MSNILGLSYMYHDSAACLCKKGDIIAAAAEERFLRRKHAIDFPNNAIEFCLNYSNTKIDELDCIVFYEKPYLKFERIIKTHLAEYPFSYNNFRKFLPMWLSYKLYVPQIIREKLGYRGEIFFSDHHYAHAASAFLPSPFERAIILTVDGTGEWTTLAYGIGEGTRINLINEIQFPHSLGLLYSAVTAHLGFKVNSGEGKVMGLAAYGAPFFVKEFERIIDIKDDGSFRLDLDYFSFHHDLVMTTKKFSKVFGSPRAPESRIKQQHMDLAATLQYILEKAVLKIVTGLHEQYKIDYLCIAGGVGLNCATNGKILASTPFKEIFIQPAAGDDGASIGAAIYAYTKLLGGKKRWRMNTAYLGPEYSEGYIKALLESRNISYNFMSDENIANRVAQYLSEHKIVGWFRGRMEFGPRALGNRSILANPCNPEIKQILNNKVKHRESFRPYAPAVCAENVKEYFDIKQQSPFMTISATVVENKRNQIPGVVHVDGTARVQTVSTMENPLFYKLLREFEKITGIPIVLNTSFNIRGEPIVCSPEDALKCFMGTKIDFLVLGNFLIDKTNTSFLSCNEYL